MTKYIHYKNFILNGLLVSDNADESARGYTLGLEIECDRFDAVLNSMFADPLTPYIIRDGIVMNENMIGFEREFMRCMSVKKQFSSIEYTLRVIHDDPVVQFTKRVLTQELKASCGA